MKELRLEARTMGTRVGEHAAESVAGNALLAGGGELGSRMRATDWSATPLGALSTWPQSLLTTVSTCLNSRFPILVWWGPQLVMLYNDAYRVILAGKHPAALGAAGREVWPEIWDIIGPMLEGVLERGEATWSEDQLLLVDRHGYAEESYFTFSYSPIRDESGGVGGVFTAVTETTERVLGERRLATLRDLAERTANASAVAEAVVQALEVLGANPSDVPFTLLYLMDDDGRVARLAGSTRLDGGTSWSPTEVVLDAAARWPIRGAVESGEAQRVSAAAGDAWGQLATEALVLPLARPGEERPYGVLIVGISPHRALDEPYRDFLGLVSGALTSALARAQAYEAERSRAEALAELNRAKTAFFSNVSHEFRTPLTLLLGPTQELLSDASITATQREQLALVQRNALRMQRLVNTLLEFSRIEAGRLEAVYEPTELAAYTAELVSTFRSATMRAGLTLTVSSPPLPVPVHVDRSMWEMVVLNLLSNAFKHTFEGGIDVSVTARDGHAELCVRDTGVGIPAAYVPRLFERFHRVPNARSRTHEGTGIGLSLVSEVVRLHGGTIDVSSIEGRGTTFTVRIPFGTTHLPLERIGGGRNASRFEVGAAPFVEEAMRWLPDAPALVSAHRETRPRSHSGARVLVVDDNADMRDYIVRLLQDEGWEVETAPDGQAALAAIRTRRPSLVLSDVMMPLLDGFGLLHALRADPETSAIPVLLLSARAGEEAQVEGLDAGADDYLIKPFSAKELLARVRTHLTLGLSRADAAAQLAQERDQLRARAQQTQAALDTALVERARLADLFRQAPAFICVLRGRDLVFEMVNDAYDEIVGHRPLLGLPAREALPEIADQGYFELLDAVLTTGQPFMGREMPIHLRQRDGTELEERFVTFVYQAITEADGTRSGIFVHGVDVTDHVRSRMELEVARSEAEVARGLAESANRAKSEFLAAMSHELRTPLNAIAGYTQLIRLGVHGSLTPPQEAALDRIERSEQHLLSLINDVLNFAKLEAGRIEYDLTTVNLQQAIAQVAPMVELQLEAKDLAYSTLVTDDMNVRADAEKLQQILLNLLSNAVKFTEPGGRVTLAAERCADDPGYLQLSVSDTGIGIPAERQESVFDPFVQVHRNLTRSTEGTGLGLAISRDLARGMGGDLRVRSVEGEGSTFTLLLPVA